MYTQYICLSMYQHTGQAYYLFTHYCSICFIVCIVYYFFCSEVTYITMQNANNYLHFSTKNIKSSHVYYLSHAHTKQQKNNANTASNIYVRTVYMSQHVQACWLGILSVHTLLLCLLCYCFFFCFFKCEATYNVM